MCPFLSEPYGYSINIRLRILSTFTATVSGVQSVYVIAL